MRHNQIMEKEKVDFLKIQYLKYQNSIFQKAKMYNFKMLKLIFSEIDKVMKKEIEKKIHDTTLKINKRHQDASPNKNKIEPNLEQNPVEDL